MSVCVLTVFIYFLLFAIPFDGEIKMYIILRTSVGSGADPGPELLARQVILNSINCYFPPATRTASLAFGRYQIILHGERGTWV